MPISEVAAANVLNKELGGEDYDPVESYWIGFRNGGVELSDGDSPNYSRIESVNDTTNWPSVATRTKENGTAITTPQADGDWLEADEVVLYDAETAGNVRYSGFLDQPFALRTGQSRSFAAGAIKVKAV